MTITITRLKLFLLLICISVFTNCFALIEIPALSSPVIDQAGFLEESEIQQLQQQILRANATGKIQPQILTVNDLDTEAIENFSIRVVEQWELGDKVKDNGVLIIVAKKQRKMRIEVGSGLEGMITDINAFQIINSTLTPAFKQQQFASGFSAALNELNKLIDIPATETVSLVKKKKAPHFFAFFPFIIMILLNFIFSFSRGQRKVSFIRGLVTAGLCSLLLINRAPWPVLSILGVFGFFIGYIGFHSSSAGSSGAMGSRRNGGNHWNSGSGGSGWGGSGGGFSGGGASGDW